MYDDTSIRLHSFQATQQITTKLYSLLFTLHLFLTQCHLCFGCALG